MAYTLSSSFLHSPDNCFRGCFACSDMCGCNDLLEEEKTYAFCEDKLEVIQYFLNYLRVFGVPTLKFLTLWRLQHVLAFCIKCRIQRHYLNTDLSVPQLADPHWYWHGHVWRYFRDLLVKNLKVSQKLANQLMPKICRYC